MSEILLDKFAEKVASLRDYTVKTAQREEIAKSLLKESHDKAGVVLLMALRNLHGIEALFWEPEVIWLTLHRDNQIDMSEEGRNKLMAVLALIHNPAFFWDNLVFQRTTQALNDELFDHESLQECHPGHMDWAVYEASLVRNFDPEQIVVPEIDEDVQQYVAVCLKRAGYVYPPNKLRFAEDNLLSLLPKETKPFADEVKKAWAHVDKKALPGRVFREDPLDVQLAQLASCYLYVQQKANTMASDILSLEKGVTSF